MKLITLLSLVCLNTIINGACLSREFEKLDSQNKKSLNFENLFFNINNHLNQTSRDSINYMISRPATTLLLFAKFFCDQSRDLDIFSIFILGQTIDTFINCMPITLYRLNSSASLPIGKKLLLSSLIVLCLTTVLAQPVYGPQNGVGDFGIPSISYPEKNDPKRDALREFESKQYKIYTSDTRNCPAKWLTSNIDTLNTCLEENDLYICKKNIPDNFNKAYEFDDILKCIKNKDDCIALWEGYKNSGRNFILTSYSANTPEICFSVIEQDKVGDIVGEIKFCFDNLKDGTFTFENNYHSDFTFSKKFLEQLDDNEKLIKYGITTPGSHCGLLATYNKNNNGFKNGDKLICVHFIQPKNSPDERQLCVNINNPSISEFKILKPNSGLTKIKNDPEKIDINDKNFVKKFLASMKEAYKTKVLARRITYSQAVNEKDDL